MWCHCRIWCRTIPSTNPPRPIPSRIPGRRGACAGAASRASLASLRVAVATAAPSYPYGAVSNRCRRTRRARRNERRAGLAARPESPHPEGSERPPEQGRAAVAASSVGADQHVDEQPEGSYVAELSSVDLERGTRERAEGRAPAAAVDHLPHAEHRRQEPAGALDLPDAVQSRATLERWASEDVHGRESRLYSGAANVPALAVRRPREGLTWDWIPPLVLPRGGSDERRLKPPCRRFAGA